MSRSLVNSSQSVNGHPDYVVAREIRRGSECYLQEEDSLAAADDQKSQNLNLIYLSNDNDQKL